MINRFFNDKVVIVTGSARGIGRETARQALAAGARVVINGRNPEAVEKAAAELGSAGRVIGVAADLSHPEEAHKLVATVLETWGRIDVLVNNAGLSMRGPFADLDPLTVRTMVDANLLSAVWATQAALPALRQSRGRVLFLSSLAGVRGFPGVSLYSASKMALAAIHQSLRAEEGPRGLTASLVYLPFVENDPGKTVLGADGQPFHHERRWTMTQAQVARTLLETVARGRRQRVLTASGKALFWGQALVPGLIDRFVRASGGRVHAVEKVKTAP